MGPESNIVWLAIILGCLAFVFGIFYLAVKNPRIDGGRDDGK